MLLKHVRLFGLVTILGAISPLAVSAQTPPSASQPSAKQPAELPRTGPAARPRQQALIGLAVFSSDGNKVGMVDSIDAQPDGKITAIHIKTGGFLGFGAKVVTIPEGKFQRVGGLVRIGLTAEEISKLPERKDQA